MTKPASEPRPSVSADTISRMATEVVGTTLPETDRKAVADLLQSLLTEMAALRTMDVGVSEPATLFDAGESQS